MTTLVLFIVLLVVVSKDTCGYPTGGRQGETPVLQCPNQWTRRGAFCYRYFDERLTWTAAQSRCQQHFDAGGMAHLASLHDQAENDFIFQLLDSVSQLKDDASGTIQRSGIWTGLHQELSNGPWAWSDGSPVDYTHWLPGEPDNGYQSRSPDDEDCVGIMNMTYNRGHESIATRQWRDLSCTQGRLSFVCKMPTVLDVIRGENTAR